MNNKVRKFTGWCIVISIWTFCLYGMYDGYTRFGISHIFMTLAVMFGGCLLLLSILWCFRSKSKKTVCLQIDDYTNLICEVSNLKEQIKELELNPLKDLRKENIDKTRRAAIITNRSADLAECTSNEQLARFAVFVDGHRLKYMYVNFILDAEDEKSIESYLKMLEIAKYAFDLNRRK